MSYHDLEKGQGDAEFQCQHPLLYQLQERIPFIVCAIILSGSASLLCWTLNDEPVGNTQPATPTVPEVAKKRNTQLDITGAVIDLNLKQDE